MSKEMKDFLSQFMNQGEAEPTTKVVKKPVEKKAAAIKEDTAKPVQKVVAVKNTAKRTKNAIEKTIVSVSDATNSADGVGDTLAAETFLKVINSKSYAFERKKNLQIDDQLFNVLNLLKQHEGIKSIATLLNAIVEKYVEDNKDDLKRILSKNPLG